MNWPAILMANGSRTGKVTSTLNGYPSKVRVKDQSSIEAIFKCIGYCATGAKIHLFALVLSDKLL